jgi:predicted glycogen debranching enzyme
MWPTQISEMTFEGLISHEWLSTNGVGGYACSTLCGLNTRKYHGLLVAAMSPPARRMVLLSRVEETVVTAHGSFALDANEYPGAIFPQGHHLLRAFSADPFPRWAYQGDGFTIEKSLSLLQGQNVVCLSYALLGGDKSVALHVRPLLALRGIHELMYQWNGLLSAQNKSAGQVRIPASSRTPEVFFAHDGDFAPEPHWYLNTIYRREEERGYAGLEDLWNPGIFRWMLAPGQTVYLVCATEPVELDAVRADLGRMARTAVQQTAWANAERDENLDALMRAASAFVAGTAEGPTEPRVIGQYPWSPPSGRAAVMGFSGLFLVPGRIEQARALLLWLAGQIQDGLTPTEYSEDAGPPKFNGADTSLWFINAVGQYFSRTDDEQTVRSLLPAIETIITAYRQGTKLGIVADADGLIASGAADFPTSWMDAQTGNWVVTPRRGRTVELNALWFNALRLASSFASRLGNPATAQELAALADSVQSAFNRRFWNGSLNCCFDVVDQESDASVRPNQILAISLTHQVLAVDRHKLLIQTVLGDLLTPMGLRTLSARDPAYQGRYGGNVVSRDRAQHQGSVYPWLLGHLATGYLRAYGRSVVTVARVRSWLDGCLAYLRGDGVGQLCELFDGDAPYHPGGAPASALSVAEILRCYAQDVLGIAAAVPTTTNPAPMPRDEITPATTQ